ncbi:hypothetical protein BDBG_07784 [Blastomyces gilchristii SLH14081]|uniref:Uncharacterized protein n=1 Tax=Blastomyces gilchristii (strain SLH14081) TaxID=559298 RepID=A0A179UWH4_BLAGS|nr:uncharacterized protein BDBG_07784 [Blastomyces gilchristii SLH14081]OAT12446.1 hypothetical protein BDBG_07784 [Blastomyces gilchristii SLH14081]
MAGLCGERCAKIIAELPDGTTKNNFLKVVFKGPTGSIMCEGEFEFMKSLHNVMPTITPKPWAWGEYKKKERYFMLTDFREGRRKVWPKLHKKSGFPTGKFGFHTTLPVTPIHMFTTDLDKNGRWPEFERLCDLTFESSSERGQKYKAVPPFMETVGMRIQQDTWRRENHLSSMPARSNGHNEVFEDMKELCRTYCPGDYRLLVKGPQIRAQDDMYSEAKEAEDEEEEGGGGG